MELMESMELSNTEFDLRLRQAMDLANSTHSLTPIVKEELKLTILSRRMRSGQGEITLEDRKPNMKRELTEEEVGKKLRRKEQNRRAAERCRIKKKKINEQLAIDYIQEQHRAQKLEQEIAQLRKEKEKLQRMLDEHAFTCPRSVTPSPSYDDGTTFFGTTPYTCPASLPQERTIGTHVANTLNLDQIDHLAEEDYLMYPMEFKPTDFPSCTMSSAAEIPDMPLPLLEIDEDFAEVQQYSPDLGRRSVTEFNFQDDFLNPH